MYADDTKSKNIHRFSFLKLLYLQWNEVLGSHASCTFSVVLFECLV